MSHPKLERITEKTLTPDHVERVRRAVLGVPRKNSLHRAILADCAGVLDGNDACRETVVDAWNAMVTPIGELIEKSSMGAAIARHQGARARCAPQDLGGGSTPQATRAEEAVAMSRVHQYPALRRHAWCEPHALGNSLLMVISRALACRSTRHADRSKGAA